MNPTHVHGFADYTAHQFVSVNANQWFGRRMESDEIDTISVFNEK